MSKEISPEDFAKNYKKGVTDNLEKVISTLNALASKADQKTKSQLDQSTKKLKGIVKILCDVPPPCSHG
jgi:signal transduction histidine kinase